MNIVKSARTGKWIIGSQSSGAVITISPDRLEQMLRTGKLPFADWRLKDGESIGAIELDRNGIKVFIESNT